MDWIEESEGLPVFAWLHLFDAHEPYPGRRSRSTGGTTKVTTLRG